MNEAHPSTPPPAPRRASGVVRPQVARWHQRLAARLIWCLAQGLAHSLRWRVEDPGGLLAGPAARPVIFAIWHNRLALALIIHRRYFASRVSNPAPRLAALVSASRDGGLLARVLELFEIVPIRGSSSRRGAQALRELTTAAETGCSLAITPDGPRGPRYVVQEGVIAAAQLSGLPIVPVSYRLSWKHTLRSWDRFQVPLPFSRCNVVFGAPLVVPPDLTDAERESFRQRLEQALQRLTLD